MWFNVDFWDDFWGSSNYLIKLLLLLIIRGGAHNSVTDKKCVRGRTQGLFSYFIGFGPIYLLVLLLFFYFCEKLTTKEQSLRARQICRICSKFHIAVIMFMIYVQPRFHMPIYNWWSVIAIKSRSRTVPHDLHLLTIYSAKIVHWQTLHNFSRPHHHTSFQDLRLGVSSVIPASRGRVSPMLLLPIVGN
jgi:hypothetical protein